MVGDVKQSSYKFRLACPELFLKKYKTYTAEESSHQKIELHQNFRSRETVLDSINDVDVYKRQGRPVIRLASDSDASEGSYEEDEEFSEEWQEATASDAVRKPEFYWSEDFDGVTVTLSAKEGVFPEGAWAEVEELDAAGVATNSDASGTGFVFDIALYDEDGGRLDVYQRQSGMGSTP